MSKITIIVNSENVPTKTLFELKKVIGADVDSIKENIPGVALAEEKTLIWLKPIKNIDLRDLRL